MAAFMSRGSISKFCSRYGYFSRLANRDCSSTTQQVINTDANEQIENKDEPKLAQITNRASSDKKLQAPPEYRFIYPEFLPDLDMSMRHHIREKLERMDMLSRRRVIDIPEFYVGSILAVTAADKFAPRKQNRFVGICIFRAGHGMRAVFTLRNIVDHQGIEIQYDMYNPTILSIDVLKLEKRLDDELLYLRDSLPEYSTFPFDMEPVPHLEGSPIPINPLKVKLRPPPWDFRYELKNLKGVERIDVPTIYWERATKISTPWAKYDLMKEYRKLIPEEEQQEIYSEVYAQQKDVERLHKKVKRKSIVRRPIK